MVYGTAPPYAQQFRGSGPSTPSASLVGRYLSVFLPAYCCRAAALRLLLFLIPIVYVP